MAVIQKLLFTYFIQLNSSAAEPDRKFVLSHKRLQGHYNFFTLKNLKAGILSLV